MTDTQEEEIEPCPVCGQPGVLFDRGRRVVCSVSGCTFLSLPRATWNYLSRAVQVYRGVTHIDIAKGAYLTAARYERGWDAKLNDASASGHSLSDALIALAKEVHKKTPPGA